MEAMMDVLFWLHATWRQKRSHSSALQCCGKVYSLPRSFSSTNQAYRQTVLCHALSWCQQSDLRHATAMFMLWGTIALALMDLEGQRLRMTP